MNDLKDKVAIVTGASSGIGEASARLLAGAGVKVVLNGRKKSALSSLAKDIGQQGGKAVTLAGDVTEKDTHKALVELALNEFDQLDIAVNNAGILGDLEEAQTMSLESWQTVIETNLTSAFLGASVQIPALIKQGAGSMIFTSSFVGYSAAFPGMAAYAASKAGIIGLVKTLAVELAPNNIRVNALLPGGTDTPMARSFANTPEVVDFVNHIHALGRQATPEEIAGSVLYLASTISGFTTGSTLLADGGVSVKR